MSNLTPLITASVSQPLKLNFWVSPVIFGHLIRAIGLQMRDNTPFENLAPHGCTSIYAYHHLSGTYYFCDLTQTKNCHKWNKHTQTWTDTQHMPTANHGVGATVVFEDGRVALIGGQTSESEYTAVNEIMNPDDDSWQNLVSFDAPLSKLAACSISNHELLAIGKYKCSYLNKRINFSKDCSCWSGNPEWPWSRRSEVIKGNDLNLSLATIVM